MSPFTPTNYATLQLRVAQLEAKLTLLASSGHPAVSGGGNGLSFNATTQVATLVLASSGVSGAMSGTYATKLDGIAAGANVGLTGVGAIGAGDAAGFTVSGTTLIPHYATATQPGLINGGGAQTIGGTKTLVETLTLSKHLLLNGATLPASTDAAYYGLWLANEVMYVGDDNAGFRGFTMWANAKRSGSAWAQIDASRPSWNLVLSHDPAQDYFSVSRAAAGVSPGSGTVLFRVNNAGVATIGGATALTQTNTVTGITNKAFSSLTHGGTMALGTTVISGTPSFSGNVDFAGLVNVNNTVLIRTAGTYGLAFWKTATGTVAQANIGMSVPGGAATDDLILSTSNTIVWSERLRLTNAGLMTLNSVAVPTVSSTHVLSNKSFSNATAVYGALASGSQFRVGTTATNDGAFLTSAGADSMFLSGGVSFNGSSWAARATQAGLFEYASSTFSWFANTGLSIGGAYTPTLRMSLSTAGLLTLTGGLSAAFGGTLGGTYAGTVTLSGAVTFSGGTTHSGLTTFARSSSGNVVHEVRNTHASGYGATAYQDTTGANKVIHGWGGSGTPSPFTSSAYTEILAGVTYKWITGTTLLGSLTTAGVLDFLTVRQGGVAVATLTGAETLTSKVLTSPTINGATISGAFTGSLRLSGNLGVGNSAAATTLGAVVKKIEVFDAAGVSLGFLPVYDAIT